MLDALARVAQKARWSSLVLTAAWFGCALFSLLSGGKFSTGVIHGLESEKAMALANQILGRSDDRTVFAVLTARNLDPGSPEFARATEAAFAPLRGSSLIESLVLPEDIGPPEAQLLAGFISPQHHAALAAFTLAGDGQTAAEKYPAVRAAVHSDVLSIACTGLPAFTSDLDGVLERDLIRAELVSMPVCILLLLAVFRSVAAALVPVIVGALSVVSGIACVTLLSRYTEVAQYTVNMCSLIGTGVAIDYSLFIVSRYREELRTGSGFEAALRVAMNSAGRTVLFSGFAVMTGLAGLLLFPGSYLSSMGVGGAIVVGFAVIFSLTFVPALLVVLGPRIEWGRLSLGTGKSTGSFFRTMAEWAMSRPLRVLVPALGVLVLAGLPFLRLRMAEPDVRVLPTDIEARRGFELLREWFPERARSDLIVAVEFPGSPSTPERVAAVETMMSRAAALPSVRGVQPQELGDRAVRVVVTTDETPDSSKAQDLVRALRANRAVADGKLSVGGDAASNVDSEAFLRERTPRLVGLVVIVTYFVLLVLLRSVLLPLKAVLMNFLSIAASFGALVWVFQDGHLFVHEPRPIDPSLPVLLFCALFGLSMDYEVLMLMRMKEAHEEVADDRTAVILGLERSAGLITSAAAIMIAVFGAFALSRVVVIQAVGFGMALAVALDATLVRVLVVPTTMRLLGRLNWWAPRFLFPRAEVTRGPSS